MEGYTYLKQTYEFFLMVQYMTNISSDVNDSRVGKRWSVHFLSWSINIVDAKFFGELCYRNKLEEVLEVALR